ncbi:hypothetical protein FRC01_002266, partial [Tulasnella sp. 417]
PGGAVHALAETAKTSDQRKGLQCLPGEPRARAFAFDTDGAFVGPFHRRFTRADRFPHLHRLPPLRDPQRFLIICAPHSNRAAKRAIAHYYDVATALITQFEDSNWNAVTVHYVEKGDRLQEATAKVNGGDHCRTRSSSRRHLNVLWPTLEDRSSVHRQFSPQSPEGSAQRFLILCAPHSDKTAKPAIGKHYDVATALLTHFEDSHWNAATLRCVEKGDALREAMATVSGTDIPFDGSRITAVQLKAVRASQQSSSGKSLRARFAAIAPGRQPQLKPTPKRKRESEESIREDARKIARMAHNTGQKYVVTQEDRHLLARYLADALDGTDWNHLLMTFVENKEGAGRWSYPNLVSRAPGRAGLL